MGHFRVHGGVGGDLGTALCPQSDRWGKGFGEGLSDAPVHVLLFLRGTWVRVSPFPAATKRVSGARARRGGPREAGNPWDKIPDPCNAVGPRCSQPVLETGELPAARRSLAEGRIYGLTRGDPTALGPAAPPPRAAEGRFLGQARGGCPTGPLWGLRSVGVRGVAGVSVRGRGKVRGPGGQSCPASCLAVSPPPRSGDRYGHLPRQQRGPAGRGPWRHFRAGRRRSGSGAAGTPDGGGGGTTAPGPERTPPPSAGRAGGTMITSAGEGAARGSAARRCFAESGP